MKTRAGENYIVAIREDEVRVERCAGCGIKVYVSEEAWRSAKEFERDHGLRRGATKAACRRCISHSGAAPAPRGGRGLIL